MIKRIIPIIVLLVFTASSGISQDKKGQSEIVKGSTKVVWYSFEEAVTLAKEKPKKIFIDVYTDWCGWCKKMDKDTFTHPVIAAYLNEHFYPVKFNGESTKPITFGGKEFINENPDGNRSPHQLAIGLLQGRMSYPSIAYMNENLQLLTAIPGYQTPEGLEPIITFIATDEYLTTSFDEYKKNFQSNIK